MRFEISIWSWWTKAFHPGPFPKKELAHGDCKAVGDLSEDRQVKQPWVWWILYLVKYKLDHNFHVKSHSAASSHKKHDFSHCLQGSRTRSAHLVLRGLWARGTAKLHSLSLPLNLLENLNASVFIPPKNATCSVSMANLKIVLLSAIFKIFFFFLQKVSSLWSSWLKSVTPRRAAGEHAASITALLAQGAVTAPRLRNQNCAESLFTYRTGSEWQIKWSDFSVI